MRHAQAVDAAAAFLQSPAGVGVADAAEAAAHGRGDARASWFPDFAAPAAVPLIVDVGELASVDPELASEVVARPGARQGGRWRGAREKARSMPPHLPPRTAQSHLGHPRTIPEAVL